MEIQPLQFLKALLPEPSSLGPNYQGQTSIGCQIRGLKDGKERTLYIFNNCSHQMAYQDAKAQAVSYTTGVPAALGTSLIARGNLEEAGCMEHGVVRSRSVPLRVGPLGLPWEVVVDGKLAFGK
jgi:saccharopine dehydrogenase (NAD+, L-lysine-forming)